MPRTARWTALLILPVLTVVVLALPSGTQVRAGQGRLVDADGYVEEGASVSPFDDGLPAIGHLSPRLRHAVQQAARAARADGIELRVASGWRSRRYQQLLLDRATDRAGREAAAKLVLAPDRSEHVRGAAVDVGPTAAAYWLGQHGMQFGLCQTYANEVWHFQLAAAAGGPCPAPSADPSQR
ncbi:MAG: D-alanyl-D-alanine carboxypeptidase family protein [Patulibacter minatonensis]